VQGGAIAVKVALENSDIFAGLALIGPAFIICPRWLSTSTAVVSIVHHSWIVNLSVSAAKHGRSAVVSALASLNL